MKTFVSLTAESLVATEQIVSIVVSQYLFPTPLKDLTAAQRRAALESENRWGVLATLTNGDTIKVASGLSKEQATAHLSNLICTLNK